MKEKDGSIDVTIVGLGYVGLPLLKRCLEKKLKVGGIDKDVAKITRLTKRQSVLHHVAIDECVKALENGTLKLSSTFKMVAQTKAVLICLPTPLTKNHTPDLSYIEMGIREIAKHASKGILVVLESTTYPGTTEEVLRPILEQSLGQLGKDFYLAYSPEREDPGNPLSNFDDTPKVVAGSTKECQRKAIELYSKICSKVVPVSSCTMAEMVKIWENTFRAINISAVNELKMVCDRMNLDVWEVVEAAKTKPYGFTPFYPGPGMGGHCIPVDPFYLSWKAKEFGIHTRFIELAGEINFRMHHYVANKVIFALNDQGKSLKGAKILIVGLAYKANIDDIRESPSLPIISTLQKEGAQVDYHDPHVPIVPPIRHFQSLEGKRSLPLNRETITHYDLCLILTQHDAVPYELLAAEAVSLVDTRNAMANFNVKGRLYKA